MDEFGYLSSNESWTMLSSMIKKGLTTPRNLRLLVTGIANWTHGDGFVEGSKWPEWADGEESFLDHATKDMAADDRHKEPLVSAIVVCDKDDVSRHSKTPRPAMLRCVFGNPFRPFTLPWQKVVLTTTHHSVTASSTTDKLLVNFYECPWRTREVLALAQAICDTRDWEIMPLLADALEDAGCADQDALWHLRGFTRCFHCLGDEYEPDTWCTYCGLERCLPDWWGRTPSPTPPVHARGCHVVDKLLLKE